MYAIHVPVHPHISTGNVFLHIGGLVGGRGAEKKTISRLYFLGSLVFEGIAAQDFNIKTFFSLFSPVFIPSYTASIFSKFKNLLIKTIANKTFQYTQQLLKCPFNPHHWDGSFSLTSLSMGDWLEKMIHLKKGHLMRYNYNYH